MSIWQLGETGIVLVWHILLFLRLLNRQFSEGYRLGNDKTAIWQFYLIQYDFSFLYLLKLFFRHKFLPFIIFTTILFIKSVSTGFAAKTCFFIKINFVPGIIIFFRSCLSRITTPIYW